ncbi:bifunctional methylenetetrahydrofolate dehydrogenase/methenyltetrahydrofolate cyclohydrolase FolD [Dethiobacter alkaliphilus]|uniref:bifunctional methylenetetrahydrofolate dehydrogenase/methenyltetrahydrofolate cyclohydrolase FolD n=1 Tax=Dethiobacter alkaliphilus TaxID=427926 RepID=UPI002227EA05|nr:bifunctional methylenetetrahydrofolate dehydrogenase/methenyltetrahydrofolate cyclohydrolase FolD [Dethiobacter alkaliphilus]MCW3490266.1 bifunctional methylenetetrahydrofolate dehydrogenase/methenyltetrahydrofolate cyclohydrolase FolD [Dethiobacter alkaliphilus]
MTAKLISGPEVAAAIREQISTELASLKEKTGKVPGLAVILVGEDPASQAYVGNKEKTAGKLGFHSVVDRVSADITQEELLKKIDDLNNDEDIQGILVQLPLPDHIEEKAVIDAIAVEKDVDGFHPINVGNLMIGDDCYIPCTPHGCMKMLEHIGYDLKGKNAVVVGRSNIVGKPVALLMLQQHATVTICHSRTADLGAVCREADVLVVAVGRPNMITGDMVKPGAVVIDVGINRVDGKLVGDVEFDSAKEVASHITPVPGGVGPMTITMLMLNTLEAFKRKHNL